MLAEGWRLECRPPLDEYHRLYGVRRALGVGRGRASARRMLAVVRRRVSGWLWWVYEGDEIVRHGNARTRRSAVRELERQCAGWLLP
jgi:hypothetical protein